MFTANSRTDHFSDSKIVLRLSLPDNINNIEDTGAALERAENILSSDRMALYPTRDPQSTQIMMKSNHVSPVKHTEGAVKATQNNTDNKEMRDMSRTLPSELQLGGQY